MSKIASLFSGPKTPEPVRMPDQNDPAAIEERRRKEAEMLQSGGRASTILSGRGSRSAGTTPYTGTILGS